MKMMKLTLCSLPILFLIGCAGSHAIKNQDSNVPANRDLPENKKLAQALSLSNDHTFVIDLSQRLGYLIEKSGRVVENVALEVGKVSAINGKKVDYRPPTGIFSFQLGANNQNPLFKTLLSLPTNASFSPMITNGKIEEFQCKQEKCLAMKSTDLTKLSKYVGKQGLVTVILKKGEWLSEENHLNQQQKLERFLISWEKAWESRDINQYMKLYATDFTHPKFNRENWKKHKSNLFSVYKKIDITTDRKTILNFGPANFVQFMQKFNSNSYTDSGIKTLILSNEDTPQIIFEDWAASNP